MHHGERANRPSTEEDAVVDLCALGGGGCLRTYGSTGYSTYIPTYLHTYMRPYIHTYIHTDVRTYIYAHPSIQT